LVGYLENLSTSNLLRFSAFIPPYIYIDFIPSSLDDDDEDHEGRSFSQDISLHQQSAQLPRAREMERESRELRDKAFPSFPKAYVPTPEKKPNHPNGKLSLSMNK